jgi:hypothetical protein
MHIAKVNGKDIQREQLAFKPNEVDVEYDADTGEKIVPPDSFISGNNKASEVKNSVVKSVVQEHGKGTLKELFGD